MNLFRYRITVMCIMGLLIFFSTSCKRAVTEPDPVPEPELESTMGQASEELLFTTGTYRLDSFHIGDINMLEVSQCMHLDLAVDAEKGYYSGRYIWVYPEQGVFDYTYSSHKAESALWMLDDYEYCSAEAGYVICDYTDEYPMTMSYIKLTDQYIEIEDKAYCGGESFAVHPNEIESYEGVYVLRQIVGQDGNRYSLEHCEDKYGYAAVNMDDSVLEVDALVSGCDVPGVVTESLSRFSLNDILSEFTVELREGQGYLIYEAKNTYVFMKVTNKYHTLGTME